MNDVIQVGGAASNLRPVITAIKVNAAILGKQILVVSVSGLNASVNAGNTLTASILRPSAYLVMSAGSGFEMRFYSPFTGNVATDPYVMISNQIGMGASETTPLPFSLTSTADQPLAIGEKPFFVHLSLSVRAANFDNWLKNKQSDSVNTYAHIETTIHPRINP